MTVHDQVDSAFTIAGIRNGRNLEVMLEQDTFKLDAIQAMRDSPIEPVAVTP